ncbi:MAG: FMN-binding protein [Ruminococcaceae bacterium]|nr:FMN-binding protein [Oscillospiraceae bacterium]
MKKSLSSILSLVGICAVMAILLALTNYFTAPVIKKNQEAAANKALYEVMPNGGSFEKMDLSAFTLPKTVTAASKAENGGYVITLVTTGFDKGLTIMCGVDANGVVTGAVCLESNETLGHEKTYGANFTGKNAETVDTIALVSGATKTTTAYKNAVKDALNAAIILGGGSVDIRTPEEILAENLSAALPAGEGKFTKLFLVEVIAGVDTVYTADNGAGFVYVIGEDFYGVPTGATSENETVAAAHAILSASEMEEIDLTAYEGLSKRLKKATRTATGNFVLEVEGAGYGIEGYREEYSHPSGEYILVRVSITPDGTIIDTLTAYQAESVGIGDACAKESFYGQFDGKTEETYREIDAISGATYTTNGYLKAIENAFKAVKILKGGAEQ